MFVLGFSNFEKSTEIRSENFSLVKQPARALYLNRGKVFWLFYLPNFQTAWEHWVLLAFLFFMI